MSNKEKKLLLEQEKDPLLDDPIEKSGPDKSGETIKQKGQENRESTNVVPDNKEKVLNNKIPQPNQTEQDKDKIHQKGVSTDKLQGTKDVEKFDKEMAKEIRNVKDKSDKFQKSFDTIFAFMGIDDPKIKTAPFNAKAVDDSKEIITDMKQSEYNRETLKEQYEVCDADYDKFDEQEISINESDDFDEDEDFEYDPLLDENFDDSFDENIENNIEESEADQLRKVRQDGTQIKYIRNPSEQVKMQQVTQDGSQIRYINNPSEQVQMQQVNQDGTQIKYIRNPSEQVQIQQVKQDGRQLDILRDIGITPSKQVEMQQENSSHDYNDNEPINEQDKQTQNNLVKTDESVYIIFNTDLLSDNNGENQTKDIQQIFKTKEEAIKYGRHQLEKYPNKYFMEEHKISKFIEDTLESYKVTSPVTEQVGYKIFLSVVDQIENNKITKEQAISKFKIQQEVNKPTNNEQSRVFTRIYRGIEKLDNKKK